MCCRGEDGKEVEEGGEREVPNRISDNGDELSHGRHNRIGERSESFDGEKDKELTNGHIERDLQELTEDLWVGGDEESRGNELTECDECYGENEGEEEKGGRGKSSVVRCKAERGKEERGRFPMRS